jgi:Zn-dependent peptidase ImmA (M78 family)
MENNPQRYIQWCDGYSSRVWSESTKVIEINVKNQGNEVNIRWVIRHELRHLRWNNPSEDFANGYEP